MELDDADEGVEEALSLIATTDLIYERRRQARPAAFQMRRGHQSDDGRTSLSSGRCP